jgi:hypothetical protein
MRRARFLADSSSILDSSFDLKETMVRVAKLLISKMAEWCILYFYRDAGSNDSRPCMGTRKA